MSPQGQMAAWLDLVCDATGQSLVDTGRLEEIVQGMSHPKSQYPSFISFIGNGSRIKALQALFPHNNVTRKGPAGLARLHLSTATAQTEHPVIFVESNLSGQPGLGDTERIRQSTDKHRRFPIPRGNRPLALLQQEVIREKILPWTQILCLFAGTVAEIEDIQQLLSRARGRLLIGTHPIPDVMRVVIVLTSNPTTSNSELNEMVAYQIGGNPYGLNAKVLDLRSRRDLSPPAAYEPLRRLILDELQETRMELIQQHMSFSAFHLNVLWSQSFQLCAGNSYHGDLDCLLAARKNFPPTAAIVDCLNEFFSQAREISCPPSEVHSFVASALLMDAYPPEMHPGFMADGHYDSDNLEETLKKAVDPQRRIFDVPTATSAGCRVAIVTSRVSDGKACVWANYRGTGRQNVKAAYQFLMPRTESQNPFLWEVARCSVAAPFFFRTKSLPGFGLFQDGGVRANNPLAIAFKESTIVWPSTGSPDLLLSVGTGFSDSTAELDSHRSILRDRAVSRMVRATLSSPSSDGEQGFHEALNCIPDQMKADIFRVDQALSNPLPRLDDVGGLSELTELQFTVPDELVRAILATAFFFFELDKVPLKRHGVFDCQGSILCTRSDAKPLLNRVVDEFPGARYKTIRGHDLGHVNENDGCTVCGYYRKKVWFSVSSLEEITSIVVAGSTHQRRIGGFPKSMEDFLRDQQAYAQFGRPDHLISSWPPSRNCFCSRGTKRRIQFLEPNFKQKKSRL
ncbi:hypothetical protein N7444_011603 [Penicillium canescens]|nr:hypothetical protein N7444_011603 [Penicillium canescens]